MMDIKAYDKTNRIHIVFEAALSTSLFVLMDSQRLVEGLYCLIT